jgi:hypothetical protein
MYFLLQKSENRRAEQAQGWEGVGTRGRRMNMVQTMYTHACKHKNNTCWNCSRNHDGGGRWNRTVEGVNSSMIYLIHCKNLCKYSLQCISTQHKNNNNKNTVVSCVPVVHTYNPNWLRGWDQDCNSWTLGQKVRHNLQKSTRRVGGMAQVVKHMPSKHEALNSNPRATKNKQMNK